MEADDNVPYTFRPHLINDLPFLHSSWGKSYYEGVNGHKLLSPEEFHIHHRPIREKILSRPNVAIIICASKEDLGHIIGYIIVEKPPQSRGLILHYIYVKQVFKREGIAHKLIQMAITERPVLYTHSTIIAGKIVNKFKARGREELERFFHAPHLI